MPEVNLIGVRLNFDEIAGPCPAERVFEHLRKLVLQHPPCLVLSHRLPIRGLLLREKLIELLDPPAIRTPEIQVLLILVRLTVDGELPVTVRALPRKHPFIVRRQVDIDHALRHTITLPFCHAFVNCATIDSQLIGRSSEAVCWVSPASWNE